MDRDGGLARAARMLAWAAGAVIAVCIGFALLGIGLIALEGARSQVNLDAARGGVWWRLYTTVVSQALLPHVLLSLTAWLVIARRFPAVERSWQALLMGMIVAAAGVFPLVGSLSFSAWTPTSPRDYVVTLSLMTGGTSAALALPRWLFRSLGPGAFTAPRPGQPEPER